MYQYLISFCWCVILRRMDTWHFIHLFTSGWRLRPFPHLGSEERRCGTFPHIAVCACLRHSRCAQEWDRWRTRQPGLVFWETARRPSAPPHVFVISVGALQLPYIFDTRYCPVFPIIVNPVGLRCFCVVWGKGPTSQFTLVAANRDLTESRTNSSIV